MLIFNISILNAFIDISLLLYHCYYIIIGVCVSPLHDHFHKLQKLDNAAYHIVKKYNITYVNMTNVLNSFPDYFINPKIYTTDHTHFGPKKSNHFADVNSTISNQMAEKLLLSICSE